MHKFPTIMSVAFLFSAWVAGGAVPDGNKAPTGDLRYKDAKTDVVFSVESDGVYLVAASPKGTMLWCRTPYSDLQAKAGDGSSAVWLPTQRLSASINLPPG